MNGLPVLSVGEVSRLIRELLEGSFPRIAVRGEISNLSRPQSGHVYFTLMDDAGGVGGASRLSSSQISCVVWRSAAARLRGRLENGQKVIVTGRISLYEPRGTYQLVGEQVEPAGLGELQRAFEELKDRLKAEGLFDSTRKRPLPFLPRTIGLVTSPSGAAVRDVLRVLYRRHPNAWVRLVPVRVQGTGAGEEIAQALRLLGSPGGQVEVIILTRGGGSLEDLWAFNEEIVARAIHASPIPVISAIGHEVDFTIADFVADVRAQTPTKAAEIVVPDMAELRSSLRDTERRLSLLARNVVQARNVRLERLIRSRPLRHPSAFIQELLERLDDCARSLRLGLHNRARQWEDSLSGIAGQLDALSPIKVLSRGYCFAMTRSGHAVKDASSLHSGDDLDLRFARGSARVEVRKIET